ncbi:hypothetical protein [Microcoleus sp. D2_18a_B4]|uniref:hypothetical protein n=1 Tax=Microcoleus sp. D2_18a_B4 TaxID=3055329 RepID=UPI002FD590ED
MAGTTFEIGGQILSPTVSLSQCSSLSLLIGVQVDRINVTTSVKQHNFEFMEIVVTLVLGSVLFVWGMRFGRVLVRSSVTAKDLFKGRNSIALALAMHSRAIVLTWMPQV